jgi:hypothetical protein
MKQTAVEFLIEQISSSKYFYNLMEEIESRSTTVQPNAILQQAKEMEKQQIIDAVNLPKENRWYDAKLYNSSGEQYFNQTFKKD